MTYEIFKEILKAKLLDYMPEEYKNMTVLSYKAEKVNRVLDCVILAGVKSEKNASPSMYVKDWYDFYTQCDNLQMTLENAANWMENAMKMVETYKSPDFDNAKDNIVFQLIHTEQNKELLSNVPHRSYLDMSVIYRWSIDKGEDGLQSIVINEFLAKKLELDEEKLYQLAIVNTERILPPVIMSLHDLMKDICVYVDIPEELEEFVNEMKQIPQGPDMWVITNSERTNGACSIMYEDKLYELASKIEDDLYILPSSIHECVLVRATDDPYELAQMVADINECEVKQEDRLSNQVYYYDRIARKTSLATDTPNKSIDDADYGAFVAGKTR